MKKIQNTVNQDFKNLITEIKFVYKITQADVSDKIGVKSTYLSDMINGRVPVTDSLINKIYEVFSDIKINAKEDFISDKKEIEEKRVVHIKNDGSGVPYFEDIEATATIASSYSDFKETPTFYIDYEHFNDCTAYVPVVGDSMYPTFCSGEIIAIKKIFNLDVILWGEAYFIVTNSNANDIKAAKLMFPHEDDSKVVLRSSNPNYKGDTVINKKDILHLYLIKGKIHRKHL